jgi:thiol:disulfide interchange protein
MRSATTAVCIVMLLAFTGAQARQQGSAPAKATPATAPKFDPLANPVTDLEHAIAEAARVKKRIILDVGGEWCGWCHTMDRFYAEHADLMAQREKNFVWLKINYSTENQNKAFLSSYPAISGYPHLFVLERDGKLLHSQDTALLEKGPSYDLDKMVEFLTKWTPTAK